MMRGPVGPRIGRDIDYGSNARTTPASFPVTRVVVAIFLGFGVIAVWQFHPFAVAWNLLQEIANGLSADGWLRNVGTGIIAGTIAGMVIGVGRRKRLLTSKFQEQVASKVVSAFVPDPRKLLKADTYTHMAAGLVVSAAVGYLGGLNWIDLLAGGGPGRDGSPLEGALAFGGGAGGGTGDFVVLLLLLFILLVVLAICAAFLVQLYWVSFVKGAITGGVQGGTKALAAGFIEHYEPTPPPPEAPIELEARYRIDEFLQAKRLRSRHPSPFVDELRRELEKMNAKTVDEVIAQRTSASSAANAALMDQFAAYLSEHRAAWPAPPPPYDPGFSERKAWAVDALLGGIKTGAITGSLVALLDIAVTWFAHRS